MGHCVGGSGRLGPLYWLSRPTCNAEYTAVEHGVTGNTGLGEPLNSVAKVKVAAKNVAGTGQTRSDSVSKGLS